MHLLITLLIAAAIAGTTRVPTPGDEAWHGSFAAHEPPGSCAACRGPRAFAVLGGVPWFLLSDRLVSGEGTSLRLPSAGVDLAAGPGGLWVLCREHLARLDGDELLLQEPRWQGTPVELAADGAVMSELGVDGQPFAAGQQSPWGGGLGISEQSGRWLASWPGQEPITLPGEHIVDARPVGLLASSEWVLALTDSADGSAPDAVRFVAVKPGAVRDLVTGAPNGDLDLQPRRIYAVDPVDGAIYTLVVMDEDRLSLRRY